MHTSTHLREEANSIKWTCRMCVGLPGWDGYRSEALGPE